MKKHRDSIEFKVTAVKMTKRSRGMMRNRRNRP